MTISPKKYDYPIGTSQFKGDIVALYLVTYALNRPGHFYPGLFKRIETCGAAWHVMDATWFVQSEFSAAQLADKIKDALDANDKLVVCKVTADTAGWALKYSESEWLKCGVAGERYEPAAEMEFAIL